MPQGILEKNIHTPFERHLFLFIAIFLRNFYMYLLRISAQRSKTNIYKYFLSIWPHQLQKRLTTFCYIKYDLKFQILIFIAVREFVS